MFKRLRYSIKMKFRNFLDSKQTNNEKNYIINNEIHILNKLNECIMYTPSYHNDLYSSIEKKLQNGSNNHDLIELCCIHANIKNILDNLNIKDIKLLYLYLENIDYIAKNEYNISDIFSIVDENDNEIQLKNTSNGNIKKYRVKVNIVRFNLLYNKVRSNFWDSVMKSPQKLIFLCVFVPILIDKMVDLFIVWKWGV